MVQIRESIPLLEGETDLDSASLTALASIQLNPNVQLNNKQAYDVNQLSDEIDLEAWLKKVAERIGQPDVPILAQACQWVKACASNKHHVRSGEYATGIGMADILCYLFQEETALVAAMLYRSARLNLIEIEQIRERFGDDVANLVKDTLSMGQLSENIEKRTA